jgi:hypothetical protein
MAKSLRIIGALVLAFVTVGAAMAFAGLPRSSIAGTAPPRTTFISPEEITRSAGPMPLQVIENYH